LGGLNPGPLGNMLKQAGEISVNTPVVGIWGTQAPDLLETAGKSAENIVYTYYYERWFYE